MTTAPGAPATGPGVHRPDSSRTAGRTEVARRAWHAEAERDATASPARLANLISAVIFADANTISYRRPLPDGDLTDDRAVANRMFGPRRSRGRSVVMPVGGVEACPADDADPRPGHESTITIFFAPDSGTTHASGEYVLWRQANDSTPVMLVQHVLRDGQRPFLAYKYAVPSGTGMDSLAAVPRGVLPISRADTTGTQVDVRALRDVEWRFLVVLDAKTQPEHTVRLHVVTSLPAIDRLDRHECRERWRNRSRALLTKG